MATVRAVAILAAALVVGTLLLSGGASAQSPSSSCTSVLVSLSPCLNYISGNESTAPASCCTQLGKVAASDPQCLCVALDADPASLGLSVNRTRALGLPDECRVKTPPVSDCKKQGAAAAAPTGEAPPASGSTGSSKTTPSTSIENGAGPLRRGSAGFIVVAAVLAVAAIRQFPY